MNLDYTIWTNLDGSNKDYMLAVCSENLGSHSFHEESLLYIAKYLEIPPRKLCQIIKKNHGIVKTNGGHFNTEENVKLAIENLIPYEIMKKLINPSS